MSYNTFINVPNERKNRVFSHCHIQEDELNYEQKNKSDQNARRKLIIASILCLIFMVVEVVCGILSNSLAIATDAAHLLTDFASFMISLTAIWLSSRPPTKRMNFGWYRAEVLGALLSVLLIWNVTILLVYMAIERLINRKFEIDSNLMVVTASLGLVFNIVMAIVLSFGGGHHHHGMNGGHSHSHDNQQHNDCGSNAYDDTKAEDNRDTTRNTLSDLSVQAYTNRTGHPSQVPLSENNSGKNNINVRAALIHIAGDFLQSLGVLITALLIHFEPSYAIVDPICTFLFSFLVTLTTLKITKDAMNVLMEGLPNGVNFIEVRNKLQSLPGVVMVHNLRIWSLSMDKVAVSTHLVVDNTRTPQEALKAALECLKTNYNFLEVTVQVEEYGEDMKDCVQCHETDDSTVFTVSSSQALLSDCPV